MSTFDFKNTLLIGWPILSVLLVFSILTVSIFFECTSLHRRIRAALDLPENIPPLKPLFDRAEQRLAVLGTLANAAPFVGLLGTVLGIIRAFHTISQASGGGGGMALVAGGISEALFATAAGLGVAIPASMLFNYFTFHNEKLMERAEAE
jgi:biopolymer transport protein ExbB